MKRETEVLFITEQTEEKGTGFGQGIGILVLLLYYYVITYGCTLGFLSIFPVACDRKMLWIGIFLIGLFFAAICETRRFAPFAILLTALTYGWVIYQNWDLVRIGAEVILDTISQSVIYYRDGKVGILHVVTRYEMETMICILLGTILYSGMIFSGLLLKGGRFFTVLAVSVIFASGLAAGQVPDFVSSCLMILGLIGAFGTDGIESIGGQKGGAVLLAFLAGVLMILGIRFLEPAIRPWFAGEEQLREKIQKSTMAQELTQEFVDWTTSWATTGISDGDLGKAEFINPTNETVLNVTTDLLPQKTIYLRCYTGADYTGKAWHPVEDRQELKVRESIFQTIVRSIPEEYRYDPLQMEIQVVKKEGDYRYRPYFSTLEKEEKETYHYRYYPKTDVDFWYGMGMFRDESDPAYIPYVRDHYLDYPKNQLKKLEALCNENPIDPFRIADIQAFIVNFLNTNAVYNLKVGACPEDQEFTEYFLFEKKQGYCVHFATAAALMFRMYGIPSRYVTGYIVEPEDFQYENGNYTAKVASKKAHAWAEIYRDGEGWVPVEATPRHVLEVSNESPQMMESSGETQRVTESIQTETMVSEIPEELPEVFSGKIIFFAATGICLLLAAILEGRRRWIIQKRHRAGVKEIFYDICALLAWEGFNEELENADYFTEAAVRKCSWLPEKEFALMVELAMRANFGKGRMTKEEIRFAREMYQRIRNQIKQDLSGIRKFQFHMIKVL